MTGNKDRQTDSNQSVYHIYSEEAADDGLVRPLRLGGEIKTDRQTATSQSTISTQRKRLTTVWFDHCVWVPYWK